MALGWLGVASVALGSNTLSQEGGFRLIMRIAGIKVIYGACPVCLKTGLLSPRTTRNAIFQDCQPWTNPGSSLFSMVWEERRPPTARSYRRSPTVPREGLVQGWGNRGPKARLFGALNWVRMGRRDTGDG